MASNKKADDDRERDREDHESRHAARRMGLAEVDLRWLYGGSADGSSARGDVGGLRSSMGSQLDAARLGIASTRGVDVSASTDRVESQIMAARREECIIARLAALGDSAKADRIRRVLRLSYSGTDNKGRGVSLPGGFPALALLAPTAVASWTVEVQKMARRYVNGAATGQAEADKRHQVDLADLSKTDKQRARASKAHDAALSYRRTSAAVGREVVDVAERWVHDEGLLADHLKQLSPSARAAVFDEVESMTSGALAAFTQHVCWERRQANTHNPLSARRCDRCGHHDPSRRADERRGRAA